MSEMTAPGSAEPSAINRIRVSWLRRGDLGREDIPAMLTAEG
jgi:hypothetical protein